MYDSLLYIDVDQVAAERCRRPGGLAFFVKEFWDVIVPNPLVWNWHMEALCNEIQEADERVFKRLPKQKDIIMNVPPGTSKTMIVSVLSTAWELGMMPEIKVFVGSYSDSAVSGIADKIKLVMKSDKYLRMFPATQIRKDRDSLHLFNTTANGEFYAFTVGGTITSKHADILKVDDPLNPKQAASEAELKNACDFFDKTLPTRKVDKDVTITYLVMQRLAFKDPTGHLLDKKKGQIHHICLPGTLTKNVKPEKYKTMYVEGPPMNGKATSYLDLGRLGPNALKELKTDLGSHTFAGQVQQEPLPDGGLVWQKWLKIVPDQLWPDVKRMREVSNDWDLAFTSEEKNAASAFIKSGLYGNMIYIEDFDWQWLEFPDLIKWMKSIKHAHYIEAKASGKSAKQTLKKMGVVAIEVQVQGGSDKIARARAATPTVEAGMVAIRQSMADRFYTDEKQGILRFPKGQYKDLADCLAQMVQRRTKAGKIHVGNTSGMEEEYNETEISTGVMEGPPVDPLEWIS